MSNQDGGFGKRGQTTPAASRTAAAMPQAKSSAGFGIPPFVKQVGGIAVGAAIVWAIVGGNNHTMKQAGKEISQHFSEQQQGGIGPIPDVDLNDPRSASEIQTCIIKKGPCR